MFITSCITENSKFCQHSECIYVYRAICTIYTTHIHIPRSMSGVSKGSLPGPLCVKTETFEAFSQNCEKRPLNSSCLFVRLFYPHENNSAQNRRIFVKFYIWVFFEIRSTKFKFY